MIFFLCTHALGQNLILNPSFELYKRCPIKETNFAEVGHGDVNDWFVAIGGNANYFNKCSIDLNVRIPYNRGFGFKYPRTGAGMIGMSIYPTFGTENQAITSILKHTLKMNATYLLTFYISPASNTDKYCTDAIGAYLSEKGASYSDSNLLKYTPQIVNPSGHYICDTTGWYKISGFYKAKGNEKVIVIGNFKSIPDTKVILNPGPHSNDILPEVYFFLDDVSLYECNALNDTILPGDTTLCPGQSIIVEPISIFPNSTFVWDGLLTVPGLSITSPGIHYIEVTSEEQCSFKDSIKVNYVINNADLIKDTLICESQILSISFNGSNLNWTDNQGQQAINLTKSGTYYTTLEYQKCPFKDTLNLFTHDCSLNIPNIFTPNEDGVNDAFEIKNVDKGQWGLTIYNRWGSKVYHSFNYRNEFNAKDLSDGVYFYLLENISNHDMQKGWVQVQR